MATEESRKRSARRHHQRVLEQWHASPEYQAGKRYLLAQRCYRLRHPYTGSQHNPITRALLFIRCTYAGIKLGVRPPMDRRCRKRLGSRYCWNWRIVGDRCQKHVC